VEGRIQKYKRLIEPLGESRPDWWIFCRLAERMGSKDFVYKDFTEIAEEMSRMLPALHEASFHHQRKGRPSFVWEDGKAVPRLIPLDPGAGTQGNHPGLPAPGSWADVSDVYRGLNLREEFKGLRRLRERTRLGGTSQEG